MKDTKNKPDHAISQKEAGWKTEASDETTPAANAQSTPASAESATSPPTKPFLGTGELIIGALIIILIAAVAYTYLQQPPESKPGPQPATGNATDAFITSLYKMRNINGYEMSYVETDGPMETEIYLQSNVTHQFGRFDSILDSREFYFDGTNTTLCLDYKGKRCYLVAKNGSAFDSYAQSIYAKFLESPSVRNSLRTSEKLVQVGAIKFSNQTSSSTIAGRKCTAVSYAINYGGLSIDQLRSIGISPDDPSITSFGNFRLSQCADDEFGLPLSVNLSYSELGKERAFGSLFTSFAEGFDKAVVPPPENSGIYIQETEFAQLFNSAQKEIRAAYLCEAQNSTAERDSCYRTLAYSADDGRVCGHVSDSLTKSQCYLAVAQKLLSPNECAFAGGLADECLISIAGSTGARSLCELISNETLVSECNKAVGDANARGIYPKNQTAVCNADSGCVVAGCNGELCVPAAIANQTNTTCDPTLTCYKQFANCACSTSGQCELKKQGGFAACLDKWETAQTQMAIQPLINATMNTTNSTTNQSNQTP
jgi:hypothetical protein